MNKFTILITFLLISTVAFAQDVLMQTGTVTQCSGTFYDSGGAGGNYSSDESFTLTICPDVPGNQIQLDFTAFSTQVGSDTITFYDGDDTTANNFGTYSGAGAANNPGIVVATPNNPTGCITIVFTSDGTATTTGWAATISCYEPCQTIVSQIDSATPAPNADGYIRVCTDEDITLNGSGNFSVDGTGATYEWDLGDGNTVTGQTATFSYPNPGVYIVNLNITDTNTDPAPGTGCTNTNLINQVIQVGTEPDFTGTEAADTVLCFGESTTIDGVVTPTEFINDCTPPVSGTTFLPDGNGASYQTCVTVDCYDSSQTLTDINQIVAICVNMEHSYLGDLDINIISPTGQVAVLKEYPGGGGTYLGGANDDGSNTPGVGADYCFSMSGTVTLENGPTITAGSNPPNNSITPGTYLPEGTLNTLLGSPLNGDWCIQIVDNLGADNGFIFSWSIEFDPNLQPPELSFTPTTVTEGWDADPTITNTTGNTITVAPPAAGQYCYTYRTTDDFGCEYTEQVCIDVLPEIVTDAPNNLFLCNPGAPPYIFDLTENDAIINAPATNPTEQIITYYETQADADNETNAIANPTAYSSSAVIGVPQDIFVRIEYLTSDCFETATFTLNVTAQPTINPALDMELCDDPSNDGFEAFNLESQNLIILGTQPATDYTVTYYTSLADAAAGVNALVSPYTNTVNPEPIFVRVQLNGDATCFNVTTNPLGEFDLIVNPSPEIISLTSNTDICSGNDAVFTITGTANHIVDYNINGGGTIQTTLDAAGESVITVAGVTTDQVITLESIEDPVTNCTAPLTNTTTVVVNANPTVALTSNTSVCSGQDSIFTITGDAGNVVDYNINGGGTVQVTLDAAGQGVVTVAGATADQTITLEAVTNPSTTCTTTLTDTETVTIGANPTITSLTTNTDICSGADAIFTIDATADDVIDYTINGGATEQVVVDATGQAIVTITAATVDQTIVLEAITNPITMCSSILTDTDTITVIANPTVALASNDEVCIGEDAVFTITGTPGDIVDYNINGGGTVQVTLDAAGESVITIAAPAVDQEMTLEAVNNPATTCTSPLTTSNTVVVNPLPTAIAPTTLEVCDDGTPDGLTEIDLTIKNNEITGGNPAYAVTYYFDQADADAQTNPLPNQYTNISNPQTIVAGVLNVNTNCYTTTTLELAVEQAPVAFTPTPLEHCDPDSDGFGVFTLTDAEAEITGGATGLNVTYHETMADADNNVNPITGDYNNIVANTQTIYVRVESTTIATDCATFVELVLIVNPEPQIITPANLTPLEVCDDDADGFASFDLTVKEPEVLNLLDGDATNDLDPTLYTITYYQTQANAEAPNNAIATPNAYVNTTADMDSVWIRVEDNATGCYKTIELELIVNPLPVLAQAASLNLCDVNNPGDEVEAFTLEDANADILAGQTGITLTYFSTQTGAETNDPADQIFSPYTNTANAQTIYVLGTNNVTGCSSITTFDIRVNPLPSPVAMPAVVEECDDDNDGFALFDLDAQTVIIENGEPDVTTTYYETQDDAMNGINPLSSPYANIVQFNQTVYAFVQNDLTSCYTIVELPLSVIPSPVVPIAIEDYVICDADNDGTAQFDFDAVINPQIFANGQTPADFTLTYHTTQAGADSGNNPIVNTSNYTNVTNPQTIYIRLVSNANSCVTTGSFVIRVEFPPVIDANYDNLLSQCDDLDADYMEANDGFTFFDLTVEDIEITGAMNVSWIVTYYETMADAQADTNAIPDPTAYENTITGPQTLYVRVTDNDTGCFSFTTVTIRVLNNPSPTPDPEDLELCDDVDIVGPNDMLETFDLTQNEATIINGELGVTASYYLSQDDAIMGNNAIADPSMHINEDPANPGVAVTPQTIYVRLTNGTDPTGLGGTGCYSLVSFDIIVNPLPVVTPVEDYVICELNTDNVADFDLTTMTAAILNGQDPAIFTVTYHETQAEADAGINDLAISGDYTNTSDPQTIYVNITNTVTGCDTTALTFNLVVDEAAQANPVGGPIVYEACDDTMEFDGDTTNDSVAFNLQDQDLLDDILDGQDPADYTVTYYETQADADAGINPLPFTYTNTVNPQVIIVRVDNDLMINDPANPGTMIDSSSCYETAEITLQVNPMPSFMLDSAYLLCINTNGSEVINSPVIDTGLDPSQYTFEWTLDGAVLPNETSEFIEPTQGGTYGVVATDNATGCSNDEVTTLVTVSEPPVLEAEVTTLAFAEQHDILVTATGTTSTSIAEYEFSLDGGDWELGTQNTAGAYVYTFSDVAAGEHTITVRDTQGCGESTTTITVMDYPLYFTPNDDGYHDTWNIYDIGRQADAVIYIFDRYGKLLKQLSPLGEGWDGTYNGNPMPTSDYWFTVEYREPNNPTVKKQFKAHFTLKR